jgi:hypothetical protein
MFFKELFMKVAKGVCLSVFSFLTVLVLAGCFNPSSTNQPGSEPTSAATVEFGSEPEPGSTEPGSEPDTKKAVQQPFIVTITVGDDGQARAVAGLDDNLIKYGVGIRNFIQVIIVDPATGTVHTLIDSRQLSAGDKSATLTINAMTYNKNYEFLLLMGHWERDYNYTAANYVYLNKPPTLLLAGHTTGSISPTNKTVSIGLDPIVVDTRFTQGAAVIDAEVGGTTLPPGNWNLVWEITNGNPGTNGLTNLTTARDNGQGDLSLFKKLITTIQGDGSAPPPEWTVNSNQITQNIGDYTQTINAAGSASFNLEYVPFSKKGYDWSKFNDLSKFDLSEGNEPIWIIRNGVNDEPQNGNTAFPESGSANWDSTKNGNGAISFVVKVTAVTDITAGPSTVTVGTDLPLSGTVVPSTATNQAITWSVKDAGTTGAKITGNTLTTTAAGTVTVTATITDGTSSGTPYTKDFSITVSLPPAAKVQLSSSSPYFSSAIVVLLDPPNTINGDSSYVTVDATVTPSNADQKVTWSINDTTLARLVGANPSTSIRVFGNPNKKTGTVTLTATAANGTIKTQDIEVKYIPMTGITIKFSGYPNSTIDKNVTGDNYTLFAVYPYPLYSSDGWVPFAGERSRVTLSSSDPTVATVAVDTTYDNAYKVTAKKVGTTTVTVSFTKNGKTFTASTPIIVNSL